MRLIISALLSVSALFAPFAAFAQSADVEAKITEVSTAKQLIVLDDGKSYQTPAEFNFDGLETGVKVLVFYTELDGKRVINDLEIIN